MTTPRRKSLESLSRKELQALAKEFGVKANQKSSDIVQNLMYHPIPIEEKEKPIMESVNSRSRRKSYFIDKSEYIPHRTQVSDTVNEVKAEEKKLMSDDELKLLHVVSQIAQFDSTAGVGYTKLKSSLDENGSLIKSRLDLSELNQVICKAVEARYILCVESDKDGKDRAEKLRFYISKTGLKYVDKNLDFLQQNKVAEEAIVETLTEPLQSLQVKTISTNSNPSNDQGSSRLSSCTGFREVGDESTKALQKENTIQDEKVEEVGGLKPRKAIVRALVEERRRRENPARQNGKRSQSLDRIQRAVHYLTRIPYGIDCTCPNCGYNLDELTKICDKENKSSVHNRSYQHTDDDTSVQNPSPEKNRTPKDEEEDWKLIESKSKPGLFYYYNEKTHESRWV